MGKIKAFAKDIIANWNTPREGTYVPYKEVLAYSVGGMGVQFIVAMFGQIGMSASCLLVASIYGVTATEIALIAGVAMGVAIAFQPIKSWLIDTLGAKKGKARPYILWLGVPTAVLISLVPFIDPTWDHGVIVALIGVAYVLLNILANFYNGQYLQLAQLISPNTTERGVIISLSSIIYSMAPTITGAGLPLIAMAFVEDGKSGLLNINLYRVAMPVFCAIGVILALLAYFGTKERVVVSTVHEVKIKFWDGMKKIVKNRYFWIMNIGDWGLFLRGAVLMVLNWLYVYMLQDDGIIAILTTLMGTASLIGMVSGPILMKLIGKKWTQLLSNAIIGVGAVVFLIMPSNFVVCFIALYLMNGAGAIQIITKPAMTADALDYQQWKTGDRLEGVSGNLSMITSLIGIGTNFVVPAILAAGGLNTDYDILYDETIRNPIFRNLALASVIGSVVVSVPYLFWNLNDKKHKQIIEELKQRAIEEDSEAGIEETPEELEARLKGITVEQLLAERERQEANWKQAEEEDAAMRAMREAKKQAKNEENADTKQEEDAVEEDKNDEE